jgi:hypothetical protein
MPDKKRIAGYVSPSEHERVKQRADADDLSMSEFVTEAVREKIDREDTAELAQQYRIEERLLGLVDDAADEAADQAADQITARVLEALEVRGQLAPDDLDSNDTEGGGEIIDFS